MSYLRTYLWVVLNFAVVLAGLSYLFGGYLGMDVALLGGLAVGLALVFVFALVLVAGVVLQILDREP